MDQVGGFTGEFYQTFRGELTSTLLKLFQKVAEEGTLPNVFYEVTITLIQKPDNKEIHKRKLQTNITDDGLSFSFFQQLSLMNIDIQPEQNIGVTKRSVHFFP